MMMKMNEIGKSNQEEPELEEETNIIDVGIARDEESQFLVIHRHCS